MKELHHEFTLNTIGQLNLFRPSNIPTIPPSPNTKCLGRASFTRGMEVAAPLAYAFSYVLSDSLIALTLCPYP